MATWTENLQSDSRVFRVQFRDSGIITFRVEYHGSIDAWVREDGGPAVWPSHPIDDRRCFWGATGKIIRSVVAVIGGENYVKKEALEVYTKPMAGEGSSFVVTNLASENCNQAQARRDSDYQNVRNAVNSALQSTIDQDIPKVKTFFQGLNGFVKIEADQPAAAGR